MVGRGAHAHIRLVLRFLLYQLFIRVFHQDPVDSILDTINWAVIPGFEPD